MKVKKDAIGQEMKKAYAKGGMADACPVATLDIHVNLKKQVLTATKQGGKTVYLPGLVA